MCYAQINKMNTENRPGIVIDSGSSIRNESPLSKEYNIISVPLSISFFKNGEWTTMDDFDISPEEFYQRMKSSEKLPQTSGSITGKLINIYDSNVKEDKSTISIHITSKHSNVYSSAILAKNIIEEKYPKTFNKKNPHLFIEVIDSKSVSIGTWFLAQKAAILANEGCPLSEINRQILETVPKIEIFTTLSTFENVVKGGRLSSAAGLIGDKLQLRPFISIVEGEMKIDKKRSLTRTNKNAQRELISKVQSADGKIVKMAIIHTNFLEGATLLKEKLSEFYMGEIDIFEAGPSLGVHTGVGGLGIAFQKA